MPNRGRVVLAAAIAGTSVACSLVAGLGNDYTFAADAAAEPVDGSVGDGAVVKIPGDGGPRDGSVISDGARPPCDPGSLDPTFANGAVAALTTTAALGQFVIFGLALTTDGHLVVGLNRIVEAQPFVELATFQPTGQYVTAKLDLEDAEAAKASGSELVGNGSLFAALVTPSNEAGASDVPSVFLSDANGSVRILSVGGFAEGIAIDGTHLLIGAADTATQFGVAAVFLDGGPDNFFGPATTSIAADAGAVCFILVTTLVDGEVMVTEDSCDVSGKRLSVTANRLLVVPSGGSANLGFLPLPPAPTQPALFAPVGADGGVFVVATAAATPPGEVGYGVLLVDSTGAAVTSFNDGGWASPVLPGFEVFTAVADAQGRLWLAGVVTPPPDAGAKVAAVARLLADGGLDPSWGNGSLVTFPFDGGRTDGIGGAAVTGDGRLILALGIENGTPGGTVPALISICP